MTPNLAALAGQRLAVYGLGREGRSLVKLLRARLPDQALTVLNDAAFSPAELAELAQDPGLRLLSGESAQAALVNFDWVFKSPGISPYRHDFDVARAAGTRFSSATRLWFAEHPGAKVVCVTGTKGKSTSSSLLAHLLRGAGLRVALGGNIGLPLFDISEQPPPDIWVLELSSYQTSDLDAAPSLSLLLNLFPEHTDWHGDHETYYRDKLNLLVQTGARPKLVNYADRNSRARLPGLPNYRYFNHPEGFHLAEAWVCEGARRVLPVDQIPLRGAHNHANLCAVLAVIRELGIDPAVCLPSLAEFRGLPHRLYDLGEFGGLRYVDDSISTTPQSAQAALAAFPGEGVTVLLGGYERHLPWDELGAYLARHPVHAVVTMGANGPRIAACLGAHLPLSTSLHNATDLAEAVTLARGLTPPGGLVLLSPGSPSYDEFSNFEQRGNEFARLAQAGGSHPG